MPEKRFFGRRIEVTCAPDPAGILVPHELRIDDRVVCVEELLGQWHDSGFARTAPRRTWLERRHRTHYLVRGDDGRAYEVYVDRTGRRREWFLVRQSAYPDATRRAKGA